MLQCVAVSEGPVQWQNYQNAACCSVLQCVAACCSVLQDDAGCCSALHCVRDLYSGRFVKLQHVVACCRVTQGVAGCCGVLQCIAVSKGPVQWQTYQVARALQKHLARLLCTPINYSHVIHIHIHTHTHT